MRWSTFRTPDGAQGVGVWRADELFPVPGVERLVDLLDSLQAAGDEAVRRSAAVDPATVELLAPVPEPPAIRDFMAFEEHVVTASAAIGLTVDPLWYRQPVFYFSNPAAVIGPAADVAISPGSAAFDYELEIAAVIGRAGADLSPAQAVDHIAGFALFCDSTSAPRRAWTAPTASARGW